MANGYSKGPGIGTGGDGNLGSGREGKPGVRPFTASQLKKQKKKKRKTSVRGPEDVLMKLAGEGRQWSTQASRYRSGS